MKALAGSKKFEDLVGRQFRSCKICSKGITMSLCAPINERNQVMWVSFCNERLEELSISVVESVGSSILGRHQDPFTILSCEQTFTDHIKSTIIHLTSTCGKNLSVCWDGHAAFYQVGSVDYIVADV